MKVQTTFAKQLRIAAVALLVLFAYSASYAQPANDAQCSPVSLTVGTAGNCSYTTATTVGATQSIVFPAPDCGDAGGSGTHDVWFSLTVPASGNIQVEMDTGSQKSAGLAIYETGSCFTPVWLHMHECDEDDGINGMPFIVATGLPVGSTVYLRVWEIGNDAKGTFKICVTDPASPGGTPSCGTTPDSCALACDLGMLLPPVYCDGDANEGASDSSTFTLSNTSATAPSPYLYMGGCTGGSGTMGSPAKDVWYKFTATAPILDVVITGLTTPTVALWEGSCGSLSGKGCAIGSAGNLSATFEGLSKMQEYFIQVSGGDTNDTGSFTMMLSGKTSCTNCLQAANLTVSPTPAGGVYPPNFTVTFTLDIDQWNRVKQNDIHGIEITHEIGWNIATLTDNPPGTSCDGAGVWDYYTGTVTGAQSGLSWGPGFFYDSNSGGTVNGNPGDNFGDLWGSCGGLTFQWTVNTANYSCVGPNDLGVFVDVLGDGQSGNWDTLACTSDPELMFTGSVSCLLPIDLLYISAERILEGNLISWGTQSELINDYYIVERSLDGQNFTEIGKVDGHGTTDERHDYDFVDDFAHPGTVWYRVHQIDMNGNGEHTDIVHVSPNGDEAFIHKIYPNPATDQLFVHLVVREEGSYNVEIMDLTGRTLLANQHDLGIGTYDLANNVADLPSGQYILRLRDMSDGSTDIQKFVK